MKVRRFPALTALTALAALLALPGGPALRAQQDSVIGTVHNLSVSGPGEIRSLTETQVCKFCHIPHTPVAPQALWSHALPASGQYQTPLVRGGGRQAPELIPQPDGSSRLCLSCHDGTVALGDLPGEPRAVVMAGAQRLGPGHRGYLGTDLSGSHPVSFVLRDPSADAPGPRVDLDMGLRPLAVIVTDPDVRLDGGGKMQCTTCHDPHTDRYYQPGRVPRFWVKPTVAEVCLACHELR